MSGKTVYILLFRGVGGATQLPTAPLRAALTEAGFENVATYINSGNAVLRSPLGRAEIVQRVAALAAQRFGFHKDIFAATLPEWSALIERNPFPEAVATPTLLHAALLAGQPAPASIAAVRSLARDGEQFAVVDPVAYLHTPNGFGRCHMVERFVKLIGVSNTARNWNTVLKLKELGENAS